MEKRASSRYLGIDRQDSVAKGYQYALLDPSLDEPALVAIPPREQ
jgi:hypothetical protein